jgi:hypothetical protein
LPPPFCYFRPRGGETDIFGDSKLANPIYLPEGGKPINITVFEIRAAHRSRVISFPGQRDRAGRARMAWPPTRLGRGKRWGERPAARSPSAGVVVEATVG